MWRNGVPSAIDRSSSPAAYATAATGRITPTAVYQLARENLGLPDDLGLRVLAQETAASVRFRTWIAFGFAALLGLASVLLLVLIARGVLPRAPRRS